MALVEDSALFGSRQLDMGNSVLMDLVLQHRQEFDSRYKGLLPLKRVYVPEVDPVSWTAFGRY